MATNFKLKAGNFLYKNFFSLYNILYRNFKLKNDLYEIELLKKLIKPGDAVLDIGGNIGFYAKILSDLVGDKGKVFCFEPDRINFKHLSKNVIRKTNINLFNCAVSDKNEDLKIYRSKLLNVDHRTYPVNNYDSIEIVKAVSIDSIITSENIQKIELIKIDIQGYELSAFKGMLNLLEKQSPKIIAEYWPHGFKRAGTSAVEFYDFFIKLNYKFFLITKNSLTEINKDYVIKNNNQPFEFSFNVLITKN